MHAKISEKLAFLTVDMYTYVCLRIKGSEMLVFSENFAYVLSEWSQTAIYSFGVSILHKTPTLLRQISAQPPNKSILH